MNTPVNTSSLDGYSVWQDDMVRELKDALSEKDIKQLHTKLKTLGFSGWMDWLESHGEEIARFLRENPKARSRQKFADAESRLLLTYGAIVHAQLAGKMGYWFHDPALAVGWNDDRDTRATRGQLLWQANFEMWDPWPFDEPPLPSPLADES